MNLETCARGPSSGDFSHAEALPATTKTVIVKNQDRRDLSMSHAAVPGELNNPENVPIHCLAEGRGRCLRTPCPQ